MKKKYIVFLDDGPTRKHLQGLLYDEQVRISSWSHTPEEAKALRLSLSRATSIAKLLRCKVKQVSA